jgi:hypothetical protein
VTANAQYMARRYKTLLALRQCVDCGRRPAKKDRRRCPDCLAAAVARVARFRRRRRWRARFFSGARQ